MSHPLYAPSYYQGQKAALRRLGLDKHANVPGTSAVHVPTPPPNGLLQRLGNTKVPLKVLAGIGAVAGGTLLANKAMQDPHIEVHPSLPMRTMYS